MVVTTTTTTITTNTTTTTTNTVALCGRYEPGMSGTNGPTVNVQCRYPSTYSRYVIVQFEMTGHAVLCELEAYSAQGLHSLG